jgi:hypothetical protein
MVRELERFILLFSPHWTMAGHELMKNSHNAPKNLTRFLLLCA